MALLELLIFSVIVFFGVWKLFDWFHPTKEDNSRFPDENLISNVRYPEFK